MKCRVCDCHLGPSLLQYENMPSTAQYLPSGHEAGVTLNVYQCPGCGLVQLDNTPVPYYKEVIRSVALSDTMVNFRKEQFSNFVRTHSLNGKKVVEIGCGRGEYLSLIQGVDVYGLEYSPLSVKQCIKRGFMVERGFMGNFYELAHAPFDAFFMLNFLEHLPNPGATLRGISCNLAEGGVGLVEVPNFDMILRNSFFSEFTRDHLLYFTERTLRTTLELNGFEVLGCKEIWHDYIISATVRKRKLLDASRFVECQVCLKAQVRKYIQQFDRVAVWGAGHQSLANLSLLEMDVEYVVDSAPFKQGRYTPATHIPIVPPDTLDSDPVDAIIVMAGSYSEEVVDIIRERFDVSVAVLENWGLGEEV